MPKQQMIVTKKGAAFYRTRMLQPGDPIRLANRDVPIHTALGYVTKPKVTRPAAKPAAETKAKPRKPRAKKAAAKT